MFMHVAVAVIRYWITIVPISNLRSIQNYDYNRIEENFANLVPCGGALVNRRLSLKTH
jgi:hypothetical protein